MAIENIVIALEKFFYSLYEKQRQEYSELYKVNLSHEGWNKFLQQSVFPSNTKEWISLVIYLIEEKKEEIKRRRQKEKEDIIKSYLCDYIKQWTEMEVKNGDEIIYIRPPYIMNTSREERKNGLVSRHIQLRHNKISRLNKINSKKGDKEFSILKDSLFSSRPNQSLNCDFQSFSGELHGKAHPDTIKNYLNKICSNTNCSPNINFEKHLHEWAIGIDCSGFVVRAIATVMSKLNMSEEEQNNTIKFKEVKVDEKRIVNKIDVMNTNGSGIKRSLIKDFNKDNPQIELLKPGDIFLSNSHVGIIYDVGKDEKGKWFYRTADSSPDNSHKIPIDSFSFENQTKKTINEAERKPLEEKNNGVRIICHRDFNFFKPSVFTYFRPIVFQDFYGNYYKK